jgi:signal transduction histidine kinase
MSPDKLNLVLVVDDNPVTRYATTRMLQGAGYDVREANTGIEGIVAASELSVDLVVLDIDLPDIDGYEVCRRIRSMPSTRRVRVVYLSASFVDDKYKVQGFEAGADGFLTHPVEPAVLTATVASLLRTRAIELELELLLHRERAAREEAEQANRAKDDFLATLSHELRSPLTAIVGWAEVARLKSEAYPEILSALNVISRNARLQAQLISDLLDISRITAGNKLRIEAVPVSLAEIASASIDSMQATAEQRSIQIVRDIRGDAVVDGDHGRLSQIVSNLLSNAIKFSNLKGTVHVSLRTDCDCAELIIVDAGRGIGHEALHHIFHRFWQEDTSSRRSHGGLGLGLSIVKHLTDAHGGSITASSEGEGRGATFTLTLPLSSAESVLRLQDGDADTPSGDLEATNLGGVRVLIVDDDTDSREWVRHIVIAAGADTMDVSSVAEALESVPVFNPHVLVSDLAMPRRNGFDLLLDLRKIGFGPERLPVIALSAFASADDRKRALDAQFSYFVAKPPDPVELLRLVKRASAPHHSGLKS